MVSPFVRQQFVAVSYQRIIIQERKNVDTFSKNTLEI